VHQSTDGCLSLRLGDARPASPSLANCFSRARPEIAGPDTRRKSDCTLKRSSGPTLARRPSTPIPQNASPLSDCGIGAGAGHLSRLKHTEKQSTRSNSIAKSLRILPVSTIGPGKRAVANKQIDVMFSYRLSAVNLANKPNQRRLSATCTTPFLP